MIKKKLICRETLVSTRVRWAHKHSFLSSDSFFFHIVYRHHHHVVMWESAGSAKKDSQPNDKLRCCATARFKSNLQHFFLSFEWWWWKLLFKMFFRVLHVARSCQWIQICALHIHPAALNFQPWLSVATWELTKINHQNPKRIEKKKLFHSNQFNVSKTKVSTLLFPIKKCLMARKRIIIIKLVCAVDVIGRQDGVSCPTVAHQTVNMQCTDQPSQFSIVRSVRVVESAHIIYSIDMMSWTEWKKKLIKNSEFSPLSGRFMSSDELHLKCLQIKTNSFASHDRPRLLVRINAWNK